MSYSVQVKQEKEYTYFRVEGEVNYQTGLDLWQDIGNRCKALGCKKIIIEEDLKRQITDTEMYGITSQFPAFGFLGVKMALVDTQAEHDLGNKLGQLIASNRGIDAKVFQSVEDAKKWITAQS